MLTRGDRELCIAVTRANAVWKVRLDIFPEGPLVRLGTFVQLSGRVRPDGMAMGEDGSFAVAHFGLGGVWVLNRIGVPIALVESVAGHDTTNLAFGGRERRHIYVTESDSGTILRATLPIIGARLFPHADN